MTDLRRPEPDGLEILGIGRVGNARTKRDDEDRIHIVLFESEAFKSATFLVFFEKCGRFSEKGAFKRL